MIAGLSEMPRSGDPRGSLLALNHAVSQDIMTLKINGGSKAVDIHGNCVFSIEQSVELCGRTDNCTGLPGLGILERGKEEEREEGKRRETGSCYRPHLSPLVYRAQINTLRREKEAAIACCFYLPHVSLLAVE